MVRQRAVNSPMCRFESYSLSPYLRLSSTMTLYRSITIFFYLLKGIMYKINDHVILNNAGMDVTGKVIGTFVTFRHRDLMTGYVVELDSKYQGSILTAAGETHAFVSRVVVHPDGMKLADQVRNEDDCG